MGSLSIWHWLIVLLVVVLIFGTKKLRNIGQDLGGAVKGFKEGVKGAGDEADGEGGRRQRRGRDAPQGRRAHDRRRGPQGDLDADVTRPRRAAEARVRREACRRPAPPCSTSASPKSSSSPSWR